MKWVTVGGALILAAIIAYLVIALGEEGESPARSAAPARAEEQPRAAPSANRSERLAPTRPANSQPDLRQPDEPESGERRAAGDGTRVSDHRDPSRLPIEPAPESPPKSPGLVPAYVLEVRKSIRGVVRRCAADNREAIADQPKLQVKMDIQVAGEELWLKQTRVRLTNVEAGEIDNCVVDALRDFRLSTPGQGDLSHHTLTFPFDL